MLLPSLASEIFLLLFRWKRRESSSSNVCPVYLLDMSCELTGATLAPIWKENLTIYQTESCANSSEFLIGTRFFDSNSSSSPVRLTCLFWQIYWSAFISHSRSMCLVFPCFPRHGPVESPFRNLGQITCNSILTELTVLKERMNWTCFCIRFGEREVGEKWTGNGMGHWFKLEVPVRGIRSTWNRMTEHRNFTEFFVILVHWLEFGFGWNFLVIDWWINRLKVNFCWSNKERILLWWD